MRMWRWLAVVVLLLPAACADGDGDGEEASGAPRTPEATEAADEQPVTEFTWRTTMDQDGYGYVLVVDGFVGDDHAAYTMQVEPLVGGSDSTSDDVLAALAGLAVNGSADAGEGVELSTGDIVSIDGSTRVRVRGEERWYRNPWLLQEARFAMDDAEWVRVTSDDAAIADLVTAVLNERYDDAVRHLLGAVERGAPVQAPSTDPQMVAIDEILTPWIGLIGPGYPVGAAATVTGDATEGQARWRQELDGTVGAGVVMAGDVRWSAGRAEPPAEPDAWIELPDLTAGLGG